MTEKNIGFINPGAMGISLAATAINSGCISHWASEGRSQETRARAEKYGLVEVNTLMDLCAKCDTLISVCPPHAASDVAQAVLECGFDGTYADVNAISPQRVIDIASWMVEAGVDFVDGGIIGGPAWQPNTTWLYLSGGNADQVAACFSEGPLMTEFIGDDIGKASALKMCYAANTKGTTALLCTIVAAAEELGVRQELENQWSRQDADYAKNIFARIRAVTAKAWRFSGEMDEIAETLSGAGLPDGFHKAASETYQRIAHFKGADPLPNLEEVLKALQKPAD